MILKRWTKAPQKQCTCWEPKAYNLLKTKTSIFQLFLLFMLKFDFHMANSEQKIHSEKRKKNERSYTAQFVYDTESMVMPLLLSILKYDFLLFCKVNDGIRFEYIYWSWMQINKFTWKMAIISDFNAQEIKGAQRIFHFFPLLGHRMKGKCWDWSSIHYIHYYYVLKGKF